jgi:hypothetical protein
MAWYVCMLHVGLQCNKPQTLVAAFKSDTGMLCRECDEDQSGAKGQQQLHFGGRPQQPEMSSGMGRHAFYRGHRLQRLAAF